MRGTKTSSAVTPAPVRRRRREQARGPVARPVQIGRDARPQQAWAPHAGAPVALVARRSTGSSAGPVGQLRLTDRGLALVMGLLAFIVMAAAVIGVGSFLRVSNAPLTHGMDASTAPAGLQVLR